MWAVNGRHGLDSYSGGAKLLACLLFLFISLFIIYFIYQYEIIITLCTNTIGQMGMDDGLFANLLTLNSLFPAKISLDTTVLMTHIPQCLYIVFIDNI